MTPTEQEELEKLRKENEELKQIIARLHELYDKLSVYLMRARPRGEEK